MSVVHAGIRAAQLGLLINALLVAVKLVAGIVGNSYALVADAVESSTDIFSSLIVWGGLSIAARPADEEHPYGHGKAESLAAAVVALMLIGAAISITIAAAREIMTPHHTPAWYTLVVVAVVVFIKEVLFRRVLVVGSDINSTAVKADAWHHRSDAITSLAAFIGIAIAIGGGKGWEAADDYAAIIAAVIIAINGGRLLMPSLHDLMDRRPEDALLERLSLAARGVPGVLNIEKLRVRKHGMHYHADLHVQAEPTLSLYDAHILSGKVKSALRAAEPQVQEVLIHMEPFDGSPKR